MKRLVALIGPIPAQMAFVRASGWLCLDGEAQARQAACAVFGLPEEALLQPAEGESASQWGLSYREIVARTGQALRYEFGQDVMARHLLHSVLAFTDADDIVLFRLDDDQVKVARKLRAEVVDLNRIPVETALARIRP